MEEIVREEFNRLQPVREFLQNYSRISGIELYLVAAHETAPCNEIRTEQSPDRTSTCVAACHAVCSRIAACPNPREGARWLRCPRGMLHLAVPIISKNSHVATLIGGPLLAPDSYGEAIVCSLQEPTTASRCCLNKRVAAMPVALTSEQLGGHAHLLQVYVRWIGNTILQSVTTGQPKESQIVARACRYMTEHIGENIRVADVARSVSLSADYLERLFKEAMCMTLVQYLSLLRLEKAKKLLTTTNASVKAIGYTVGFRSIQQFNRAFKCHTDANPTQYRTSSRSENAK